MSESGGVVERGDEKIRGGENKVGCRMTIRGVGRGVEVERAHDAVHITA